MPRVHAGAARGHATRLPFDAAYVSAVRLQPCERGDVSDQVQRSLRHGLLRRDDGDQRVDDGVHSVRRRRDIPPFLDGIWRRRVRAVDSVAGPSSDHERRAHARVRYVDGAAGLPRGPRLRRRPRTAILLEAVHTARGQPRVPGPSLHRENRVLREHFRYARVQAVRMRCRHVRRWRHALRRRRVHRREHERRRPERLPSKGSGVGISFRERGRRRDVRAERRRSGRHGRRRGDGDVLLHPVMPWLRFCFRRRAKGHSCRRKI